MPPRDLTADDIADWLTPGQAVKILDAVFQKSYLSKQALLGRLAGGMAEAASEQSVKNDGAGSLIAGPVAENPGRGLATNSNHGHLLDDWRSHLQAPVLVRRGGGNRQPLCSAIRAAGRALDDQEYGQEYRQVSPRTAGSDAFTGVVRTACYPNRRGRRFPPAHLQAWFEFYQKIGGDMREERALESARLNFPGQSVDPEENS